LFRTIRKYSVDPARIWFGDWLFIFSKKYHETQRRIKLFREFFKQKINERLGVIDKEQTTPARRDLLHILAEDRKKYGNDPSKMFTEDEIIDEFGIFFIAGKDTTSILISMALYELTRLPEWEKRIKLEAQELFRNKCITMELISKMENLSAFLKECLRYYPPAPTVLVRYTKHDVSINDLRVKKGTPILSAFYANHFNPKYFNKPLEFNPSRWLEGDKTEEGWKKEPFAYLPFSAGGRNCIGQHLATLEAKLVLALILKNYTVKIEDGYTLEMKLGDGLIMFSPEKPIPFVLTPRN